MVKGRSTDTRRGKYWQELPVRTDNTALPSLIREESLGIHSANMPYFMGSAYRYEFKPMARMLLGPSYKFLIGWSMYKL